LHMLVLGDSIMWGQGLKDQDKFWWRIKGWLQEKTGRRVLEKIEAHSGAAIEASAGAEGPFTSKDGEVNLLTPSINEQVDDALRYYDDPAKVDLILVDGCINDVGVRNILDASTSLEVLDTNIREKCGGRMQLLLQRVVREFPRAHVVVTSYYRIVSTETESNSFTTLLAKKLTTLNTEAERMSDKQLRERLIAISDKWYRVSTPSLGLAVDAVNSDLRKSDSKQRILFAEIEFAPEHAFSAPDTLLWNFKFGSTNLSGLRKAIVVVTFGTAAYKPDDEVRDRRSKSCKETYKEPGKEKKESKAEKKRREFSYLACRYASLGHPNKMGALLYAEAIKSQLRWLIAEAGWLKKSSSIQPVPGN
ncbi:MAG: SGNH/GDSL hydrolase family protein, partial [Pyrinomonadaceae bacterium]